MSPLIPEDYQLPEADAASKVGVYVYSYPQYLNHPVEPDSGNTYYKVGYADNAGGVLARLNRQLRDAARSTTAVPEDPVLLRIYETERHEAHDLESRIHKGLKQLLGAHHSTKHNGSEWFLTNLEILDVLAVIAKPKEIHRYDPYKSSSSVQAVSSVAAAVPKRKPFSSRPPKDITQFPLMRVYDSIGNSHEGYGYGDPEGAFTGYMMKLLNSSEGQQLVRDAIGSSKTKFGVWISPPQSMFSKIEAAPGFWMWTPFIESNAQKYYRALQEAIPELKLSTEVKCYPSSNENIWSNSL